MIVLDTNVISEPMRREPDSRVVEWLDAQHVETLYLTTVTVGELRFGIAVLPRGRRRDALAAQLEHVLSSFTGRVLPYDLSATVEYARLVSGARAAGIAISMSDGMIAAAAAAAGFAVATRDRAPFEAAEVPVIDPWH